MSREIAMQDANRAWALIDKLQARVAELEQLCYNSYPHMCRDDHEQIGHGSDSDMCPLCALRHDITRHVQIAADQAQELEQLRAELAAALALLTRVRDKMYECRTSRDWLVISNMEREIDDALTAAPGETK